VQVGVIRNKYITQSMMIESIARLEDAARTQAEFENVIEWWDKRDKKIRDALDKKILSVANATFDIGLFKKGDHRMKSVFNGRNFYYVDYLNLIYCCTCQMHNLIDDSDLSRLIEKATDKQKAVFFPKIIKRCHPKQIAECHEMTDRNVRDIVDRMVSNIRKGMYEVLKKRQTEGVSLTLRQKIFLNIINEEKEKAENPKDNKKDGR